MKQYKKKSYLNKLVDDIENHKLKGREIEYDSGLYRFCLDIFSGELRVLVATTALPDNWVILNDFWYPEHTQLVKDNSTYYWLVYKGQQFLQKVNIPAKKRDEFIAYQTLLQLEGNG